MRTVKIITWRAKRDLNELSGQLYSTAFVSMPLGEKWCLLPEKWLLKQEQNGLGFENWLEKHISNLFIVWEIKQNKLLSESYDLTTTYLVSV